MHSQGSFKCRQRFPLAKFIDICLVYIYIVILFIYIYFYFVSMFICMYLCICFILEESQLLFLSTSDASGTSAVLILGED